MQNVIFMFVNVVVFLFNNPLYALYNFVMLFDDDNDDGDFRCFARGNQITSLTSH